MRSRHRTALAALLIVVSGVLAGCGGQSSGASSKPKKTNIVIRTDYLFNGYVAPYALAIEKGYFKDEGITVDLEQGQGSATTVQTVASGKDDFGITDSGTVAKAITNQDVPVKVIDVHLQKTPIGFIYKPEDKVTTAASVAKRVIISSPGAGELALLPAVTAKAGIPSSKLNTQLVNIPARIPKLLSTKNAVVIGYQNGDLIRAQMQDPSIGFKSYAAFGVLAYSTGLITSDRTLQSDPELVKRVVRAVQRGWAAAVKNPDAAVAAAHKVAPDVDQKLLKKSLQVSLGLLHTDRTKGHPLGWTDKQDWTDMLNLAHKYAGLDTPKPVSDYYTNEFIPTK